MMITINLSHLQGSIFIANSLELSGNPKLADI